MATKKLGHQALGPAGFSSQTTQLILIEPDFSTPNKLKFKYATTTVEGNPDDILPDFARFIPPRTTDLLDIYVRKNCFVQMWLLRDKLDWHWRPQDAITTSEPLKSQYLQLQYRFNDAWVETPGDAAICQGIRFGAVLRPLPEGPKDPFNLNVILEWGPNEVLPMTIDPDIQNPKV